QNPTLFTGTIESNLRFGKKDASEEEIKRAIEISQSSETVKVKGGLQSYVNRDGSNFSGGQKQRLTIARALAKSPKILILDDAFSALDFKTDYQLRKALNENLKNVDIFIVSQRVSTIKNCDEIVVLDKGRIHGVGKHEELTKTCKIYREFCQSQGMKL
ncbi:MAG: ABC transporter ATP-binding protein, partial [Firmicutes bacterium]|nr:ABC transporter ATP-binding protein [Candidatus Scatoplasma merdavium]